MACSCLESLHYPVMLPAICTWWLTTPAVQSARPHRFLLCLPRACHTLLCVNLAIFAVCPSTCMYLQDLVINVVVAWPGHAVVAQCAVCAADSSPCTFTQPDGTVAPPPPCSTACTNPDGTPAPYTTPCILGADPNITCTACGR